MKRINIIHRFLLIFVIVQIKPVKIKEKIRKTAGKTRYEF